MFAAAARTFFDRPAPEGYLAEWSRWLAGSVALDHAASKQERLMPVPGTTMASAVSVLIFRLGVEWLAFRTQAVAEVTTPRPVHRIPHRSNQVLWDWSTSKARFNFVSRCRGLLGVEEHRRSSTRLVVLRDRDRAEIWAFEADEVLGVHRVPRSQLRGVPSTLVNPAVGFSQAVLSWNERSIGLLDEQRVFAALRSLGH